MISTENRRQVELPLLDFLSLSPSSIPDHQNQKNHWKHIYVASFPDILDQTKPEQNTSRHERWWWFEKNLQKRILLSKILFTTSSLPSVQYSFTPLGIFSPLLLLLLLLFLLFFSLPSLMLYEFQYILSSLRLLLYVVSFHWLKLETGEGEDPTFFIQLMVSLSLYFSSPPLQPVPTIFLWWKRH